MMQMLSLSAHNKNGSKLSLGDVLEFMPDNSWSWYILDFYGMGCPPPGYTMESFEESIRSSDIGIAMTWSELVFFAHSLDQIIDLQIIAAKAETLTCRKEVEDKSSCNVEIVIEAFDSTEWSIWIRDTTIYDRIRSAIQ
ncbi:hypothetical protein [Pantoea sp. Cy-639]|uniref:hypothetical protein n=1 Tax=Pantoea sp. Cy-639 TaxID=2608360 RepID=UPI00141D9A38|nr:hypothetical protein [Pantoea sp. Cy-639]NIF19982.1 hypothetical protein [Pantoea sp. Cy-639]